MEDFEDLWKKSLKSEYGTAVDLRKGSVCVYDREGYCRGYVAGNSLGLMVFGPRIHTDGVLASVFPDGRIVGVRSKPPQRVDHKDIIRFLVENAPQIKEETFRISRLESLKVMGDHISSLMDN
ncbi:MAG TPA: hypothetical protein VJI46_04435 [Candidatus Nanoarchaeia archaeon]|nr:hypothetical protein [Candidatus Nanoarchaeia archaeon]